MRKDKIEPTLTFSCSTISVYLLKIRVGTVKDQVLEKTNGSGRVFQIIVASSEYMNFNLSHRSKKNILCKHKYLQCFAFPKIWVFYTTKKIRNSPKILPVICVKKPRFIECSKIEESTT